FSIHDQWNHYLRYNFNFIFLALHCRLNDRPHLHFKYLWKCNRQTATAMAKHWIGLMQLCNTTCNHFYINADFLCQFALLLGLMWDEFVKRRINQSDSYRKSVHDFKDANEVAPLVWQELVERFLPRDGGIGNNHLLDCQLPLNALLRMFKIFEKHMLGSDQADSFRAHVARFLRVIRGIGIRPHVKFSDGIRPVHQG